MSNPIELTIGVKGFYKLEAIKLDEDGNEISRRTCADWFPNLITDQGLDYMGINSGYLSYCAVGTGSTPPSFSDTTLVAPVAYTDTTQADSITIQPSSPYYVELIVTKRFSTGAAAGNLSEVGMGWDDAPNTLYSRALILDGLGSPTTITVLSDEVLDVTYRWRMYIPEVDVTGSTTIGGVSYDYTIRASNVTTLGSGGGTGAGWYQSISGTVFEISTNGGVNRAYTGNIGAITGQPAGTFTNNSSVSNATYTPGNLYRDSTIRFNLASSSSPFRSFTLVGRTTRFQIQFTPDIPKSGSNQFYITTRIAWTRAP